MESTIYTNKITPDNYNFSTNRRERIKNFLIQTALVNGEVNVDQILANLEDEKQNKYWNEVGSTDPFTFVNGVKSAFGKLLLVALPVAGYFVANAITAQFGIQLPIENFEAYIPNIVAAAGFAGGVGYVVKENKEAKRRKEHYGSTEKIIEVQDYRDIYKAAQMTNTSEREIVEEIINSDDYKADLSVARQQTNNFVKVENTKESGALKAARKTAQETKVDEEEITVVEEADKQK